MKQSLVNYVLFQIGWLSCVMFAARYQPILGLIVALVVVSVHLAMARRRIPELKLLLTCGVIGAVFDSLLLATGWVSYPSGMWLPGLAPYWIIAMWLLFASTLNLSMGWLKGKPWLAAFAGSLGGPLSYIAGERLNGINLDSPEQALIAVALAWALIMPVICWLAQRWDGFERPVPPEYVKTDWREQEVSSNAL